MSDSRQIDKSEKQPIQDDKDDPRKRLNLVDEYVPPPRPTSQPPPWMPGGNPPGAEPGAPGGAGLPERALFPPNQGLDGQPVDLVAMAAPLNSKQFKSIPVNRLAQMYLINPEQTDQSVKDSTASERRQADNLWTDIASTGIGLATKYGVDKLLTKGPGWTKPIGFAAGALTAGMSKDLLTDGQLGDSRDWLRGTGVYGGSVLLIKGMALNPTRATLTTGTLESLSAKTGVAGLTGTSGQVAEKLIAADLAGSRYLHYMNPVNYLRVAGFNAERAAAMVAKGEMSAGQYVARQGIGQFTTRLGTGFAFGAGREGLYIATGEPKEDGQPHDFNSGLSQMGSSGLKVGLTAAVALPVLGYGTRLIPGGSKVLDTGASLAGKFSPTSARSLEAVIAPTLLGGLGTADHSMNAGRIEALSKHAKALAEQAKIDQQRR
jgi:hypothetical protein